MILLVIQLPLLFLILYFYHKRKMYEALLDHYLNLPEKKKKEFDQYEYKYEDRVIVAKTALITFRVLVLILMIISACLNFYLFYKIIFDKSFEFL